MHPPLARPAAALAHCLSMPPEPPIVEYQATLGAVSPPHLRLILSVVAMALTGVAWLWLILCFTATYSAWWNFLWLFVIAFGLAFAIAAVCFFVRGRRWRWRSRSWRAACLDCPSP